MVMINDLRKLILFQRLNLGYECIACKQKFNSRRDQLNHLERVHFNQLKKGEYKCPKCGKLFSNEQVFRLHAQIHGLSAVSAIQEKIRAQKSNLNQIENKITAITSCSEEKNPKKKVGLTKVKMEDCLRCDACSCIYMDKDDYYKHMRNFHKITDVKYLRSTSSPAHYKLVEKPNNRRYHKLPFMVNTKSDYEEIEEEMYKSLFDDSKSKLSSLSSITLYQDFINSRENPNSVQLQRNMSWSNKNRKKCRSCCKQCVGKRSTCDAEHSSGSRLVAKECDSLFQTTMKDNIKDRWNQMLSRRMMDIHKVAIKPGPDSARLASMSHTMDSFDQDYMTHLLSQVEVKIETEPPDDQS